MKPNVLIFCLDEVYKSSFACYGNKDIKTPNIDSLAEDGIMFNRAYCNNPVCTPSRGTMFTGLTPRQNGLLTNGNILPEQMTVAKALKENGYKTYSAGKLHLSPFGDKDHDLCGKSIESRAAWDKGLINNIDGYLGFEKVDYVGGHVNSCFGNYADFLKEKGREDIRELYNGNHACEITKGMPGCYKIDIPEGLHYNDYIADSTVNYINENADSGKPFFAWCSFPDPHMPYVASKPYGDMYDPAKLHIDFDPFDTSELFPELAEYRDRNGGKFTEEGLRYAMAMTYGMISHVDTCIGRVLNALREKGLYEDTLIMFVADHGEYLGHHNLIHKAHWLYESVINVPFILKKPGAEPEGKSEDIVSLLDIVPTVLDYAGVSERVFDRRNVYQGDFQGMLGCSLRKTRNDFALIEYDEDFHPGHNFRIRGLVTQKYKLIIYGNYEKGILVDLENDPEEQNNLYYDEKYLAVKCEMLEKLVYKLTQSDRYDAERICGA